MSLQTYNQSIYFDDRTVTWDSASGTTSELSPLTEKKGMAMEFQANIKVLSGMDKYKVRAVPFTIVGDSETANIDVAKGLYALQEAAARMASDIATMSKGVLCGLYAKLGKYRQDEMPISVPTGDYSYSRVILTNDENSAYGVGECDRSHEYPATPGTAYINLPWIRDDVSRQDIIEHVANWQYIDEDTGMTFSLGQVKFKDDNEIDLVAMPTNALLDIKAVAKSRRLGRFHANNDTSLGIKDDKVASEEFNDFEDAGQDDMGNG